MKFFIKQILQPIIRRMGTALSVYLVAQGVPEDTIQTVVTGLSAGALIGIDLFLSSLNREKVSKGER